MGINGEFLIFIFVSKKAKFLVMLEQMVVEKPQQFDISGLFKTWIVVCHNNGDGCHTQACEIQKYIGYVPGEIAFPDLKQELTFYMLKQNFYI